MWPSLCSSERESDSSSFATKRTLMKNILCLVAVALLCGCAGQQLKLIAPRQQNYDVLGEGQGGATGLMLFGFIPIGQNERFVRAYEEAVKSKGGDDILNPE